MRKKKIGAFDIINYSLMILLMASFVIPFWIIIAASVSDNGVLQAEGISLQIKGFTFEAYKFLFTMNDIFIRSIGVSFLTSLLTALLSVAVCTLAAYVLSKKYLVGRKFFTVIFMITMFFSGGMIPTFLVIKEIGLYNSYWALLLPKALSVWNMFLLRNYFQNSIAPELIESAQVDGASEFRILWQIVLPLSKSILAVLVIFYVVGHWNAYFDAILYLDKAELYPLQVILRSILLQGQGGLLNNSGVVNTVDQMLVYESMKYAVIIVASLPVLIMYPILQKYFVKGIMVGSIKG